MENGYVYCISHPGFIDKNWIKIGMTTRTPDERLLEANSSNTWIPLKYELLFAKRVVDPEAKEKLLHELLAQTEKKIDPRREWFQVRSIEYARTLFDLVDGEWWDKDSKPHSVRFTEVGTQKFYILEDLARVLGLLSLATMVATDKIAVTLNDEKLWAVSEDTSWTLVLSSRKPGAIKIQEQIQAGTVCKTSEALHAFLMRF